MSDHDDVFNQWLNSGTVAQRSVDIYSRPDLFARYESLARQHEAAAAVEKAGEKSLGSPGTEAIEAQMEELYQEWRASKMTWFIRALNASEIDEVRDASNYPEELGKDASEEDKKAFEKAEREARDTSNVLTVAKAVVKIENPDGEVIRDHVSVDEMRAMRVQLGDTQVMRLVAAALVASTQEVEMPVPFSSRNSKKDRN